MHVIDLHLQLLLVTVSLFSPIYPHLFPLCPVRVAGDSVTITITISITKTYSYNGYLHLQVELLTYF